MTDQVRSTSELGYRRFCGRLKRIEEANQIAIMHHYPFANTLSFQIVLDRFVRSDVVFDVSHCHDLHNTIMQQVSSQ